MKKIIIFILIAIIVIAIPVNAQKPHGIDSTPLNPGELITPVNIEPVSIDEALKKRISNIGKPAKNVIFIIADGMNSAAITLARAVLVGRQNLLEIDRFPVTGRVIGYAEDAQVNDSASAGSAFATGKEQGLKRISVDSRGNPQQTIFELAKNRGLKVGLVSDTMMTNATPAAFSAHVENRDEGEKIAEQMIKNGFDLLLSGGRDYFIPKEAGGKQAKGKNLLEEAAKTGYQIAGTGDELKRIAASGSGKLLGLFAPGYLPFSFEDPLHAIPSISELAAAAISFLSKEDKGFLLMIELGDIDPALHGHDCSELVYQMKELEKVIKIANDFLKTRSDTLLVLVSDHGTGGMSITENFNADIFRKCATSTIFLARQLGDKPITAESVKTKLTSTFPSLTFTQGEIDSLCSAATPSELEMRLGSIVYGKLGLYFLDSDLIPSMPTTRGHTGEDLFIHAKGCHQGIFGGVLRNWEVGRRIASALGFSFP